MHIHIYIYIAYCLLPIAIRGAWGVGPPAPQWTLAASAMGPGAVRGAWEDGAALQWVTAAVGPGRRPLAEAPSILINLYRESRHARTP